MRTPHTTTIGCSGALRVASVILSLLGLTAASACNDSQSGDSGNGGVADGNGGTACGLLGVACPEGFTCVKQPMPLLDNGITEWCYSETERAVYVPSGTFWRGCNPAKLSYPDCPDDGGALSPASVEATTRAYAILQRPVKYSEYDACVASPEGACTKITTEGGGYLWDSARPEYPDMPVDDTSWHQASAYCDWWGQQTGRPWRLCSSTEWQKAALGGCETLKAELAVPGATCRAAMRLNPWGDERAFCLVQEWAWDCPREYPGDVPDVVGVRYGSASPYGAIELASVTPQWLADCPSFTAPLPVDGSPNNIDCMRELDYTSDPDALPGPARLLRGRTPGGIDDGVGSSFNEVASAYAPVGAVICCRDMEVAP